jgi:hypothetical protein
MSAFAIPTKSPSHSLPLLHMQLPHLFGDLRVLSELLLQLFDGNQTLRLKQPLCELEVVLLYLLGLLFSSYDVQGLRSKELSALGEASCMIGWCKCLNSQLLVLTDETYMFAFTDFY